MNVVGRITSNNSDSDSDIALVGSCLQLGDPPPPPGTGNCKIQYVSALYANVKLIKKHIHINTVKLLLHKSNGAFVVQMMASALRKLGNLGWSHCLCGGVTYSQWIIHRRSLKGYKRKWVKRKEREDNIFERAGDRSKAVERVYVWGNATTGALGVKSYLKPEKHQRLILKQKRPARLRFMDENHFEVYDVACGFGFTLFALKQNRKYYVFGTGINTDSQLGLHEFPRKSGRLLDYLIVPARIDLPLQTNNTHKSVKQVSCGRAHSFFLTDEGVFSQGNNSYGQLGRPIVEGEIYSKVSNVKRVPDLPDNVKKIVCGQDHTMFLTESGEVYSCGLGADGQTGLETFHTVDKPALIKGDIQGVKIKDISAKVDCVLAMSEDGEVFGWGNSEYHQLSMVTKETQVSIPRLLPVTRHCGRITRIAAGGSMCAILNEHGEVYTWGYGILGTGPKGSFSEQPVRLNRTLFGRNELQPDTTVVDVQCGLYHFAAVTDTGDIYTWGKGKHGCLGLRDLPDQCFPLKVSLPAIAHRVVCGVDHTVALAKAAC